MVAKLSLVFLIAILGFTSFHCASAAPKPTNAEILEKSIAEYLKHDKELIKELKQLGFDDKNEASLERSKRQSEPELDNNDAEFESKQPGFFDRAAKFVVELLQRFLRWINTDGS